jgi:hypothetical protein
MSRTIWPGALAFVSALSTLSASSVHALETPVLPEASAEPDENDTPAQLVSVPSPWVPADDEATDGGHEESDPESFDPLPGDPWGDTLTPDLIALRVLLQVRYTTTFGARSHASSASYREREEYLVQNGDGWEIQRLFLRLSSDPVKYVGFKAILDFAELLGDDPEDVVKQAYTTLSPLPGHLSLVIGLFKIPFFTPELDPSARFEFARFGPADELLDALDFAGRDLGLQIVGAPLRKPRWLRLSLGVFRGHAADEHDSPAGSIAGRVETKPKKSLRFGLDAVRHLRPSVYNRPFNTSDNDVLPDAPDPLYPAQQHWGKGSAYGVDARYKKKGSMLRGEFVYGDRVDVDRRYGASHFWTAWGIAAYSFGIKEVKLMPAIRAEWLDADAGHSRGLFRTLSASFTVIAWSRARFLADVTSTGVQAGTVHLNQPKPLQADPYLALSNTRLTAQLQLEL